jgi:hypothetical protein
LKCKSAEDIESERIIEKKMKPDTNHRMTRYISSQETASSEMQKRIMSLGKSLVRELRLDPGVDTLARWMAHYIAELMVVAENATGEARADAEQRCFETILKLWQHRSAMPNGSRPFENFEPIFRALARLDPANPTPYYYAGRKGTSSEADVSSNVTDEVQRWLDVAEAIDRAARVWLEAVFQQAALVAKDDETLTWLENAPGKSKDPDAVVIARVLEVEVEDGSEESEEHDQEARQKEIQSRIAQLDAFVQFSQGLRDALSARLETSPQSASAKLDDAAAQDEDAGGQD